MRQKTGPQTSTAEKTIKNILGDHLKSSAEDGSQYFPYREGAAENILRGRLGRVLGDMGFQKKQEEDRKSYLRDDLISTFGTYLLDRTAVHEGNAETFDHQQTAFRVMAEEPRLARRMGAKGMLDALETMKGQTAPRYARFFLPHVTSDNPKNCYVLLIVAVPDFLHPTTDYDKYRMFRKRALQAYCYGLLKNQPELQTCVGIAVDAPPPFAVGGNSQDIAYLNRDTFTPELSKVLGKFCMEHGVLVNYDRNGPRSMITLNE